MRGSGTGTILLRHAALGILTAVLLLSTDTSVRAQGALDTEIAQAERLYVEGDFEETARLLVRSGVLGETAAEPQAAAGYRLLILSHLQNQALPEAKLAVVRLLDRVPDYEPDPVQDPPAYTALVNSVRQLLSSSERIGGPPCRQEMMEAEALYLEGAFAEVSSVLGACLNMHFMEFTEAEAVPALRLMTLAHLKQGNLPEAKLAVVRLLDRVPDYEPDPVQDPPAYTAFCTLLKQQGGAGAAP